MSAESTPNQTVREFYQTIGNILLEQGDAAFAEQGEQLLSEALDEDMEGFCQNLETTVPEPGAYTRDRVEIPGLEKRYPHRMRYMHWSEGFEIIPHGHNRRPCFEGVTDGTLYVVEMDMVPTGEHADDGRELYAAEIKEGYTIGPGDTAVIDGVETDVHWVYTPTGAKSLHVYPMDAASITGYQAVERDGDPLFVPEEFELDQ